MTSNHEKLFGEPLTYLFATILGNQAILLNAEALAFSVMEQNTRKADEGRADKFREVADALKGRAGFVAEMVQEMTGIDTEEDDDD